MRKHLYSWLRVLIWLALGFYLLCDLIAAQPLQQGQVELQQQINAHLEKAASYFKNAWFVTGGPNEENAFDEYKAVLTLDASNQEAWKGLRKIFDLCSTCRDLPYQGNALPIILKYQKDQKLVEEPKYELEAGTQIIIEVASMMPDTTVHYTAILGKIEQSASNYAIYSVPNRPGDRDMIRVIARHPSTNREMRTRIINILITAGSTPAPTSTLPPTPKPIDLPPP